MISCLLAEGDIADFLSDDNGFNLSHTYMLYFYSSATLGHSVNAVNAQAGKFFNKIGDLFQGSTAGL